MASKKVLFITYYWPPAGGIGVLRCLKIAKYIRDFGWEPVIYTAKDAQYSVMDESNFKHVHPDTTVLKHPIIEPFNFYKMITGRKKDAPLLNVLNANEGKTGLMHDFSVWVRSNFFIPDARSLWINPSVKFLLKYLKENPVDAIFTDGPPHTNTMIANIIKEKTGIPWLADFQDPWTQVDYYQLLKLTGWADRKHRAMEQRVFRNADKITIVSPSWKRDLESIGAKNVGVIPWGYDEEDFDDTSVGLDNKFLISHLGLLGSDRNPDLFFRAIGELCAEEAGFKDAIEVRLIGSVDFSVKEAAGKFNVLEYVKFESQISRKESLQLMRRSQLLLLLLNKADNAQGRIPGKLFEYMRAGRPILCFGPAGCDVENILKETNAGINIQYDNYDLIKNTLRGLYHKFQAKELVSNKTSIEKYSIRNLTGQIAGFLQEITNKK
jgi:glycosyltransferase involved in cell wall biosynthesis